MGVDNDLEQNKRVEGEDVYGGTVLQGIATGFLRENQGS